MLWRSQEPELQVRASAHANLFYNKKTRKYTVFVCLEYNGDIAKLSKEIANKVSQKISDEQRMKIDFELENFEKEIEKELGNNTTEEDDE